MKTATLIRIIPQKDKGAGDIVPLQKSRRTATSPESVYWFSYQRDKFTYSPENKEFSRLAYPVDSIPAPTLSTFQTSEGLSTTTTVNAVENAYGKNTFDIPIPTFKELFGEHAVAPFFVFQLFCVGLWCLDEYWYYSIFTLFMLVVFECTVVFQVRQRSRCDAIKRLIGPARTETAHFGRIPYNDHQAIPYQCIPRWVMVRSIVRCIVARRSGLDRSVWSIAFSVS